LEKGEVGPQKGIKQQKKAKEPKDKRATSVDNWNEDVVRLKQRTWSPQLEINGALIS